MKILQICKKFPWPLKDGECLAITYMASALSELGADLTLLAMNTTKHWSDTSQLPPTFSHYKRMATVEIDNRIMPLQALRYLFTVDKSYHIDRFVDAGFQEKLKEILENDWFDVIQLETLYLAPYIPLIRKKSSAMIVMRAHNVEHEIWERIATHSPNPFKRWYLKRITPQLKAFEISQLNQYDLLVAITERDLQMFRQMGLQKTGTVTPIGLDCRHYMADDSSYQRPLSLSFIGSLDWMPNSEGLQWFLEKVWTPVLQPKFPELTFHIAGRNTPNWLRNLKVKNVIVHGEVDDSRAFINQHSIMVVPLRSGSGMRAKILEGMALGKVVISTSVGLEGIQAVDRREALFADTEQAFEQAIRWCYEQGNALVDTGRRAQVFCANRYDNLEITRQLLHTYQQMGAGRPMHLQG